MGAPMSTAAVKDCLGAVALFSGLAEPDLDLLARTVRFLSCRKGARIFEEGSPADCCYVMTSGRAKVVLNSEDGGEVLFREAVPGNLIGEVALLDGHARSAALVASEPCRFIVIPAAAFERLRSNPAFERKIVAHVTSTLRDATDQVRRVSTGPSLARLAWCLGQIARREGTQDGKAMIIPRKRHQELAAMAGCTRETVSRALGALRRKKFVSWDAHTMRLEVEGLQRYLRSDLRFGNRMSAGGR